MSCPFSPEKTRSNANMFQVNLLLALIALLAVQGVTASLHNDGQQAILDSQQKSADDAHQVLKESAIHSLLKYLRLTLDIGSRKPRSSLLVSRPPLDGGREMKVLQVGAGQ